MAKQSRCEDCMNYVYDEEYDCYTCEQGAELDEDEIAQFLRGDYPACPFYHPGESDYYLSFQAVRKKGRRPFFFRNGLDNIHSFY